MVVVHGYDDTEGPRMCGLYLLVRDDTTVMAVVSMAMALDGISRNCVQWWFSLGSNDITAPVVLGT